MPDPKPNPADDHLQLFATARYNTPNTEGPQEYFRYDFREGTRLIGSFAGIIDDQQFWSGYRAPFCGPDFVRSRETPRNVQLLVDKTVDALRERGVKRMKVTARPTSYSSNEPYVQHALLQRGLQLLSTELSYAIHVEHLGSPDVYRAQLKRAARRSLRYADQEPYEYRQATNTPDWATAYEIIRLNREAKGNPLALSLEYLLGLRDSFGDRIRFFILRHAGQPVASALLYRLLPDIELVEYWGDAHTLERSPMNRLAEEVCVQAIEEGVRLVDLGISSVDGIPDDGLIQFKQSIGASAELRMVFEGDL